MRFKDVALVTTQNKWLQWPTKRSGFKCETRCVAHIDICWPLTSSSPHIPHCKTKAMRCSNGSAIKNKNFAGYKEAGALREHQWLQSESDVTNICKSAWTPNSADITQTCPELWCKTKKALHIRIQLATDAPTLHKHAHSCDARGHKNVQSCDASQREMLKMLATDLARANHQNSVAE